MTNAQGIVHKLKYKGGDCVGESLRAFFPEFHSKHCDDAVVELVNDVVQIVTPPMVDKLADARVRPLHWIDDPMRGE